MKEPYISSVDWRPVVRDYMTEVSTTFNYVALIHDNPQLYGKIKSAEQKLDTMRAAPISEIMPIVIEWRGLVLKAQFAQRLGK